MVSPADLWDGIDDPFLGRFDERGSQTDLALIQDCSLKSSQGSRGFFGSGVGFDRAALAAWQVLTGNSSVKRL